MKKVFLMLFALVFFVWVQVEVGKSILASADLSVVNSKVDQKEGFSKSPNLFNKIKENLSIYFSNQADLLKDNGFSFETEKKTLSTIDSTKPDDKQEKLISISDLDVYDDQDGDVTLIFKVNGLGEKLEEKQNLDYEIRFSSSPIPSNISDHGWSSLSKPVIYDRGDHLAPFANLHFDSQVIISVHLDEGPGDHYLGVRFNDGGLVSKKITLGETLPNLLGSVVINEVAWMGSTASTTDEWLELKNLTDQNIDLSGWTVTDLAGPGGFVIPQGSVLPANGYYLVANYPADHPNSVLNVEPDLVSSSLQLLNSGEKLVLVDNLGKVVDSTALKSKSWPAGENQPSQNIFKPMIRKEFEGVGVILDGQKTEAWDTSATNFGTPGEQNK